MKKVILLAGLLFLGVACSKNDNNEPSKQDDGKGKVQKPGDKDKDQNKPAPSPSPSPSPSPAPTPSPAPWEVDPVFPKKVKMGDRNYYGLDTYFFENGKVVKIEQETYDRGQKVGGKQTTTVTYTGNKYPSTVVHTGGYNIKVEYTYNDRNQVLTVKKTEDGITKTKTFEYDASGRIAKESNPNITYVYTYPNDKTVVRTEALSSGGSNVITYTIENGNLVREVLQLKKASGEVEKTEVTTYEYDLSIKNPNLSIETRLVKPYFYGSETYSPETVSKNVLTKKVTASPVREGNRSSTFTYQKNAQGYPTEVDERTSGNARSWIAYEY